MLGTVSKAPMLCQLRRQQAVGGDAGREMVSPVKRHPELLDVPSLLGSSADPFSSQEAWAPAEQVWMDPRGLASAPRPPEPSPAEALWVLLPVCQDREEDSRKEEMVPGGQSPGREGAGERGERVGIDLRAALWPSREVIGQDRSSPRGPWRGWRHPSWQRESGPGMKEGDELPEDPRLPARQRGMGHSASSGP